MNKNKLPPCVIMAGGIGSRLGAITKKKPKPAINIKGKPFIFYTLDWLRENGFIEFIFLLSYKSEILEDLVKKYSENKNINCTFQKDEIRSGTLAAINGVKKSLSGDFFYTNADEISDINIKSMYSKFCESNFSVMSLIKEESEGYLKLENNCIKEKVDNKTGTHIELGCKFINKRIFEYVDTDYKKFEDFLYLDLVNKIDIGYFMSEKLPLRIDRPIDIKSTNNILGRK